jgi:hypothetical protein
MHLAISLSVLTLLAGHALASDVRYVDDDAPPGGNGLSWDTAYTFLQDALAAASEPDSVLEEIRVAQGLYRPDRSAASPQGSGDREATFRLVDGIALRGGYLGLVAGEGQDPDDRDVGAYETVLSGDLLGNDLGDDPLWSDEIDDNSYHVTASIDTDATAVMEGFTIRGGNANGCAWELREQRGQSLRWTGRSGLQRSR